MPVEQRLVCLFVVAVLLASHCVQGASNSAKEGDKATSDQVILERIAESGVGARIAQDASSKTQSSKHSFSVAQKRVNNPETTCEAANEWMKREYPDWKEQASNFDAHTLPKCLRQWASAILPEGMREYPVLTCNAPDGWENACSSAGGMGINVVAVATFPGNSSRQLTFPACVSGAKPCIASRTSADFMWVGLVNKIQTWCNNQSMSAFRCEGVKISSNFWTVANIPKVIKIVVGVLVAVAIIVAVIILVVYCRWKRKKEHEDALERTMLLRLARRVSNRPPGTYTDPDDMSLMTLGSNASSRSTSLSSSTSSAPGLTPSFSSIQGTRISAASLPPMNP